MDEEISRCFNYRSLKPVLLRHGVMAEEEALYLEECTTGGDGITASTGASSTTASGFLLERLKSQPDAFLQCLKKETEHIGHAYIAALVEKRPYSSSSVIAESARLKEKILRNQTAMLDINVQALKPHLVKHQLLTNFETDELDSKASESEKVLYLLNVVLESKGPTAHFLYATCLSEERSHPMHKILYEIVVADDAASENIMEVKSRKRQRSGSAVEYDASICMSGSVAKRFLSPLEMERPLKGKSYSRIMKVFQTCHHSSNWGKLEEKAQSYIEGDSIQLKAIALLEMAISYTFRGENKRVDSFVRYARSLLHNVAGNNRSFLEGRREHVLSCRYRYCKDFVKAREHTRKAKVLLFGTDAGEDSSWAHYCDACVLLEEYTSNSEMTHSKLQTLKESFQLAIDHAERHKTGMDVVKPHSHIRLAQLCMGSTQFSAGKTSSREMILEAQQHLEAVDVASLKQRSQSLYYLFRSDLSVNLGDGREALMHAKTALELGSPNYSVEIRSAQERINALTIQ